KVCGAMIDSLRTRAEMVDIAIAISTPRNHAAPVASLDQAPHLRRNVLRGAWSFTPMGAKVEPLGVAVCHGDNIWRDRNGLARRVDRALAAAGANGDGNLVIGSTRIFRPAANSARHREQERVVVEGFACFSPEPVRGFAKQGQGFGADVEVESVLLGFGIFAIAGFGSACEAAHHPFDLAYGLVASGG